MTSSKQSGRNSALKSSIKHLIHLGKQMHDAQPHVVEDIQAEIDAAREAQDGTEGNQDTHAQRVQKPTDSDR